VKNQLQVIVNQNGLSKARAEIILEKFKDYCDIAAGWEVKANSIKVTDASQTGAMAMAREGRLELRAKRIAIEKTRKELKEDSWRESKAIDGIANVLKALIVPIEDFLNQQEHFVEIEQKKKEDAHRAEVERRMEEERLAEERKAERERKKMAKENERLKAEAVEREKLAVVERKKAAEKLRKEREKSEAKFREHEAERIAEAEKAEEKRLEVAAKVRAERAAQDKKFAAEKEMARIQKEKAIKVAEEIRIERERMAEILKNQIVCPKCGHTFQQNKEK